MILIGILGIIIGYLMIGVIVVGKYEGREQQTERLTHLERVVLVCIWPALLFCLLISYAVKKVAGVDL